MQFVIVARPTVNATLFMHWLADAADAAGAAAAIAAVEGRPCEVHAIHSGKLARIDVHQPDGSVARRALFREPGCLITEVTL